jgi:ABC-2 type transport system permease protein
LFVGIFKFETLRMSRNFAPVFFALAFPVMMLLIFGGIYGNRPSARFAGQGVVDSSVPAYLILVVSVTGLMSFPLGLAEYRDRKILKRFRATPTKAQSFLVAQGLVNLVLSLSGAILLVLVGRLVFTLHMPHDWPGTVVGLVGATLAMYAIGGVVAALASTERAATAAANLIYFPMIFLSGMTIPLAIFPPVMKDISDALPATYAVRLLQHTWLGTGTNVVADWAVIGGTLLICGLAAVRFFRWE